MDLFDTMLKAQEKLITLQNTRTITKDDLILPQWILLKSQYDKAQGSSTEIRAVLSILNSILYQNRVVFCLTLDSLSELVQGDRNYTTKFGKFDRHKYPAIIKMLTSVTGLLSVVTEGSRWSPTIYKLVHPEYRKYILVDEAQQMTEAVEFAGKKQNLLQNALGKRTRKTHIVGSSKISNSTYNTTAPISEGANNAAESGCSSNPSSVIHECVINLAEGIHPEEVNAMPPKKSSAKRKVHQELLDKALASNPTHPFITGKQHWLNTKGEFTEKQASILAQIAAPKAAAKALASVPYVKGDYAKVSKTFDALDKALAGWKLTAGQKESIMQSLFKDLSWEEAILLCKTHSLPINENIATLEIKRSKGLTMTESAEVYRKAVGQ